MRKICFLFVLMIFILAITFLPTSNNFSTHAAQKVAYPSSLITFTPALTNFLPIIIKPPAPPSVNIVSSSVYTSSSTLYVVGEVRNNTTNNVRSVRVTATLHNSAGNVIRSDYSYILIDILAPGQKAPFKIYFFDYPPEYVNYQLSVSYSTTTQPAKSSLPVLSSSTWSSSFGSLYTVGEVQNNTSSNVNFVKVIITYYDPGGVVTNVDYTYTEIDVLGASQKGPFKIYADERPYNSYTFSVDYDFTTRLPASGTSITNLDIWTEFSSTQFTGEMLNNTGSNIQSTKVIATFYDNVGVVTDVNSTYLPADILASSQRGCFKLYATDRPYNSYTLVSDFSVTTSLLPGLEVLNITPSGNLHLAGQIRNNHVTQTYNFVKAVGTLYDGTGKVINCAYNYTSPSEISPGGVAPYDIDFYSHTSGWTSYSVIATD